MEPRGGASDLQTAAGVGWGLRSCNYSFLLSPPHAPLFYLFSLLHHLPSPKHTPQSIQDLRLWKQAAFGGLRIFFSYILSWSTALYPTSSV